MNITHEDSYKEFLTVWNYSKPDEYTEREKRLIYLTNRVLDLTTYCDEYSLKIGEQILDIIKFINCKADTPKILRPKVNDYLRTEEEFTYCLYVQFITQYLNWGTNIYYSWFDNKKDILGYKLTPSNVTYLISWFDCTEEELNNE
jgi:hypothetical protein